jgi:plasmid stabilization system protein ParE
MAKKSIVWSPLADQDLERILDFLARTWEPSVSFSFLDELENCLEIISLSPEAFPLFYIPQQIRRCVVTIHNSLFFKEYDNYIAVLRLYDTRQNPENLFFE